MKQLGEGRPAGVGQGPFLSAPGVESSASGSLRERN